MNGFTFSEVLVSLMLATISALALLTQQWHTHQFFNQVMTKSLALIQLDTLTEQLYSETTPNLLDTRFQWSCVKYPHQRVLKVHWQESGESQATLGRRMNCA